jgi:hypothetical protein
MRRLGASRACHGTNFGAAQLGVAAERAHLRPFESSGAVVRAR